MAELDPNIILHGYTPLDVERGQQQNAGLKLQNVESQQKIDQTKHDMNYQKTLADIMAKRTRAKNAPAQPAATPDPSGEPVETDTDDPGSPGLPGESYKTTAPPQSQPDANAAATLPDEGKPTQANNVPAPKGSPAVSPAAQSAPDFITDMRGVQQDLAEAGYGPEALKMNPALMEAAVKGLQIAKDQHELFAKQHDQIASIAAGVLQNKVDTSEQDPVKLQAQKDAFIGAYHVANQNLLKNGLESPQDFQQHEQMAAQGYTPDLERNLRGLVSAATNSVALNGMLTKRIADNSEALLRGSETTEHTSKTFEQDLKNAGQTIRGVVDQGSFDKWFKGQPKSVQDATEALYKRGYSGGIINEIATLGQNEEQRAREADARLRIADTEKQRDIVNDQRKERESFLESVKRTGANADKQQYNRDYSQIVKLQDKERNLYALRSRLGEQLAQAGTPGAEFQYIQANGSAKPSSLMHQTGKKKPDPKEMAAAVSDMKSRYDAATESLKEIVNQKYDITKDTGKISREDAISAVEGKHGDPGPSLPTALKAVKSQPAAPAAATPTPVKSAPTPTATIPDAAKKILKEGTVQSFKNGQEWTLRNGQAVRVK